MSTSDHPPPPSSSFLNHIDLNAGAHSRIASVSVYMGRAEVTRVFKFSVKTGQNLIDMNELPTLLEPDSVRVEGRGPATIHDVTVGRMPEPPEPDVPAALLDLLEHKDQISEALQRGIKLREGIQRYFATLNVQHVRPHELDNIMEGCEATGAKVEDRIRGLKKQLKAVEKEIQKQQEAFAPEGGTVKGQMDKSSQLRTKLSFSLLAENERSKGPKDKLRMKVSLSLFAEKESEVELVLVYAVLGATWTPIYDVRVDMQAREKPITLVYKAAIVQHTAEDWKDVPLTLETATPSFQVGIPTLKTWTLSVHRPTWAFAYKPGAVSRRPAPPSMLFGVLSKSDADSLVSDQEATGTTGGGIFGSGSQQQQPAGFGAFGSQTQPQLQSGGGLSGGTGAFSATENKPAFGGGVHSPTTTGAFAHTSAASPAPPPMLFGVLSKSDADSPLSDQEATGTTGGGIFGSGSQQQQPAGFGAFGSQTQPQLQSGGGLSGGTGAFSATENKPVFGAFGGGVNSPTTTGAFAHTSAASPAPPPMLFGALSRSDADSPVSDQVGTGTSGGGLFGALSRSNVDTLATEQRGVPSPLGFREAAVSSKGNVSATFTVPGIFTIPSDATKHNVTITELKLDATMSWVAVPKLDARVRLSAKIRNASDYTLLSGSGSIYVDGSFIAKSNIPAVSPGESFDYALGLDPAIRITYHPVSRKTGQIGFVSKTNVHSCSQRISVYNTKSITIKDLRIIDQVPVSADESITVQLITPALPSVPSRIEGSVKGVKEVSPGIEAEWGGGMEDRTPIEDGTVEAGQDGKLSWVCEIPSGGKVNLLLQWQVISPASTYVSNL